MSEPEHLYVNDPQDNVPTIRRLPTHYECQCGVHGKYAWILLFAGTVLSLVVVQC